MTQLLIANASCLEQPLLSSPLSVLYTIYASLLEPDIVRGTPSPFDMDQYSRLFGTSRIPADVRLDCLFLLLLSFFSVVAEWKFTQNQDSDISLFFDEANSVYSFPSGHTI